MRPNPDTTAETTASNSLFSFVSFLVTALALAVTTPIIVHHLGAEQYGIYSLSLTVVTFLALLDAGISTALVRFVADRWALGDIGGINRLVSASFALYLGLGFLGLVATVVVSAFFVDEIFNLTRSAVELAKYAFLVSGIAFFFNFISKVFSAVILGLQRNDVSARIKIALTSLTGVGTVLLVYLGFSVRALVVLTAALSSAGFVVYARMAYRLLPELTVRARTDTSVLSTTLRFSGWIFLANASAFLLFQLDRVFLGILKSVSLVTYYAIPGSIASYLYVAVANLASITIAVGAGLFALEQHERIVQLYLRATRFVLLFLLSMGIPAFVLAHPFLHYWIGAEFADRSTSVLRVLVLTYALLGLTVVPYNLILAAGRPRVLGLLNLAMCGTNLVLILILVPPYGLMGAAWAYLLSVLPLVLFVFYAEGRIVGLPGSHWLALAARFVVPAVLTGGTSMLFLQIVWNLASVIIAGVLGTGVFALVYLSWFAPREDRTLVLQILRRFSNVARIR
jgi:O-antigen/teichoic acid export membrane protein